MIFNVFSRESKPTQKLVKLKNFLLYLLSNEFNEINILFRQTTDDPHYKKCRKESEG